LREFSKNVFWGKGGGNSKKLRKNKRIKWAGLSPGKKEEKRPGERDCTCLGGPLTFSRVRSAEPLGGAGKQKVQLGGLLGEGTSSRRNGKEEIEGTLRVSNETPREGGVFEKD